MAGMVVPQGEHLVVVARLCWCAQGGRVGGCAQKLEVNVSRLFDFPKTVYVPTRALVPLPSARLASPTLWGACEAHRLLTPSSARKLFEPSRSFYRKELLLHVGFVRFPPPPPNPGLVTNRC